MVRGFAGRVKPARWERAALVPGRERFPGLVPTGARKSVLFFPRFPNVRQKTRVRGAAFGEVDTSLFQTERPVDREARYLRVVLLPVILPPTHRAQRHRIGDIQGSKTATGATVKRFHLTRLDGTRPSALTSLSHTPTPETPGIRNRVPDYRSTQKRKTSPVLYRALVAVDGDTVGASSRSAENRHAKNGAIGRSTPPPRAYANEPSET